MKASVGDQLTVRPVHGDGPGRDGEILEVHGPDGGPPYVVRWSDTGRETLIHPGLDAGVHHFGLQHPAEHEPLPQLYEVQTVVLQAQPAVVLEAQVTRDGIAEFLGKAFAQVAAALGAAGLTPVGAPFGRYRPTAAGFDVEAGFPVLHPLSRAEVRDVELPGGPTVRTMHVGAYGEIHKAYQALENWVVDNGYAANGTPWECYLDDPDVAVPRTMVYLPVAEPALPTV